MKIKRKSKDEYLDFVMKAGAPQDIFNDPNFKLKFLHKCAYISNRKDGNNFKVMYRKFLNIDSVPNIDLILFGQNLLYYQSNSYLPYIYYLENENVKFKKIIEDPYFKFEDITFEALQKIIIKSYNKNLIELLLEKISDPKQNYYLFGNRNDIFWKLVNQLNKKMQQQYQQQQYQQQQYLLQQYSPQQKPLQQYPLQQYPLQQYSPQQKPLQQYPLQQYPLQQNPPQQYSLQQYSLQQYPLQQNPPQQYPPQQYSPQQYSPQQYSPQQYSPQQYSPQQYSPQQYLPQQKLLQQYPPQQNPPQMQSQTKINELKQQLGKLINTQKSILEKMRTNSTNANKIVLQKLTQNQETLEKSIHNELQKIETNPINENIQIQVKNQQKTELEKLLQNLGLQKKQIENITKKNSTNTYSFYICKDASLEVKIQDDRNIFFGYDEYLFIKAQNGLYKFYYKYSYRKEKFMQLTKNQNEILEEKEINIDLIPTYDILRLYFAVKDLPNKPELVKKLNSRIHKAEDNISKTAEAFIKLDHSNFDKEKRNTQIINSNHEKKKITNGKYKNFGKVKKRRVTEKTYIFFGTTDAYNTQIWNREAVMWFDYVCFREDDKVFYYKKGKLNEKKSLDDFPFIFPLEDLISFILLRRMITHDTKFADQIYIKATARIKSLKTQKIAKQYSKNYNSLPGKPLTAAQQSQQQISLLPGSKNVIKMQ